MWVPSKHFEPKCFQGTRSLRNRRLSSPSRSPIMLAGWTGWFWDTVRAMADFPSQAWLTRWLIDGTVPSQLLLIPKFGISKQSHLVDPHFHLPGHSLSARIKQSIQNALLNNPSLLGRPLDQVQALIIDPVEFIPKQSRRSLFIIIDALDECDDRESITQLIDFIAHIEYFKFLVKILYAYRCNLWFWIRRYVILCLFGSVFIVGKLH